MKQQKKQSQKPKEVAKKAQKCMDGFTLKSKNQQSPKKFFKDKPRKSFTMESGKRAVDESDDDNFSVDYCNNSQNAAAGYSTGYGYHKLHSITDKNNNVDGRSSQQDQVTVKKNATGHLEELDLFKNDPKKSYTNLLRLESSQGILSPSHLSKMPYSQGRRTIAVNNNDLPVLSPTNDQKAMLQPFTDKTYAGQLSYNPQRREQERKISYLKRQMLAAESQKAAQGSHDAPTPQLAPPQPTDQVQAGVNNNNPTTTQGNNDSLSYGHILGPFPTSGSRRGINQQTEIFVSPTAKDDDVTKMVTNNEEESSSLQGGGGPAMTAAPVNVFNDHDLNQEFTSIQKLSTYEEALSPELQNQQPDQEPDQQQNQQPMQLKRKAAKKSKKAAPQARPQTAKKTTGAKPLTPSGRNHKTGTGAFSLQQQSLQQTQVQRNKQKTKANLKRIFLNYCEFNKRTGSLFISQTACQRLFKDAKLVGKESSIKMNDISILIQTVLQQKINMIKSISFPQFLDCVFAISELKEPGLFQASPKAALEKVISESFVPLLVRIENFAVSSLTQKNFQVTSNQNFIYSKFMVAQKQIVFNSDTQAIFLDILPLMRSLYTHYFDMEINNCKGQVKISDTTLVEKSYTGCLQICKEFNFMPYMVSQRVCAFIWYTVINTGVDDPEVTTPQRMFRELCNNPDQSRVVSSSQNQGRTFTFAHFLIFFYRVAILSFDLSIGITHRKLRSFNLIKKLLQILSQLEQSDCLPGFMKRIGRTFTKALSFLPSKDLLAQILICEGLDRYMSAETIETATKEDLVKRILDGQDFVEFEVMTSRVQTITKKEEMLIQNDAGSALEPFEEQLKEVFHSYCIYGNPTNSRYLKSSLLLKMLRDCNIIAEQTVLKKSLQEKARQVYSVEIDLLYKQVCKQVSNSMAAYNKVGSVLHDYNIIESNRSKKVWDLINQPTADRSNNNNSLSLGNLLSPQAQQKTPSMQMMNRSHSAASARFMSPNASVMSGNRRGISGRGQNHQSNLERSRERGGSASRSRQENVYHLDKFDFPCFIAFIIKLAPKVYPHITEQQVALKNFIEDFILPLCRKITEAKSEQNNHMSKLINLVNTRMLVDFMSELFCVLQDVYPRYAENKTEPGQVSSQQPQQQQQLLMTFAQFSTFARDYDIFPRFCSKAALYRIFHTLALMKEALQPNQAVKTTKRLLKQHSVSVMNPNSQALTAKQGGSQETIDKNLFIEAITLCALNQEKDRLLMEAIAKYEPTRQRAPSTLSNSQQQPQQQSEPSQELLRLLLTYTLDLVDAMNNSEGIFRQPLQENRTSICGIQSYTSSQSRQGSSGRKDLMAPFRGSKKYAFYWKLKKDLEAHKRFGRPTHNQGGVQRQLGFEKAMQLDTVLENADYQETSSFM